MLSLDLYIALLSFFEAYYPLVYPQSQSYLCYSRGPFKFVKFVLSAVVFTVSLEFAVRPVEALLGLAVFLASTIVVWVPEFDGFLVKFVGFAYFDGVSCVLVSRWSDSPL